MYATVHLETSIEAAVATIKETLAVRGFRVVRSFDLQNAAAAHPHCACPDHGTDNCTCQYLVLLAYPGADAGSPLTLAVHGRGHDTYLSLLDGEETEWLGVLLPAIARIKSGQACATQPTMEEDMSRKVFSVPNISCGHCTHTIQMELGDLPGVTSVQAEVATKQVTVEWGAPATWEKIKATLAEINFPPADNDLETGESGSLQLPGRQAVP